MEIAILIMITSAVTMFILGTYNLIKLDQRLKRVEKRLRKVEKNAEELRRLRKIESEIKNK